MIDPVFDPIILHPDPLGWIVSNLLSISVKAMFFIETENSDVTWISHEGTKSSCKMLVICFTLDLFHSIGLMD